MGCRKYISDDLPLGIIWSFFGKFLASLSSFLANFTKFFKLSEKDTKIMSEAVSSTSRDGGRGGDPTSSVELSYGFSDLPDGYDKIFDAAATLPKFCSNAVYKNCVSYSHVLQML